MIYGIAESRSVSRAVISVSDAVIESDAPEPTVLFGSLSFTEIPYEPPPENPV